MRLSYYVYLKLNQQPVKRPKVDSSIVVKENDEDEDGVHLCISVSGAKRCYP